MGHETQGLSEGRRVRLEPLVPAHAAALLEAAEGDPDLWRYLPYGPFASALDYADWIQAATQTTDPRFSAVIDLETGLPAGVVTLMRDTPAHRVIEIGHVWFGASLQRTPKATEAIYLLAREAFDERGYRRLEWKCDAANARSRRAAERFGFTFEGVFRQHQIVKGRNRDTAWFSLLDGEWPAARAGFERWLDPANFDRNGLQRATLQSLRTDERGG